VFSGPITVTSNAPVTGGSALKIRSAGEVKFDSSVNANAAADLNVDVHGDSISLDGSMTATGGIELLAANNLTLAAVNVTADSDLANGGNLLLRADSDLQAGGNLSAQAASELTGAEVELSGAEVQTGRTEARIGDARITAGGSAVLAGATISTAASVQVRAALDIFVGESISAFGTAALTADFDSTGTGLIAQSTGQISAAAGVFSAAAGISGSGSPGLPAGLTVRLGTISAQNTGSGDIRIVQVAAGGSLAVNLLKNSNGSAVVHVLDGSLTDNNGQDLNLDADTAELYVTGGNIGSGSTDIFRGTFDPLEVKVSNQLTISAPSGFAALSGVMDGPVVLTAQSALLQSSGDVDLSAIAPVITANLAVISGGHVTTPDAGLAVTGDLRIESQTISSAIQLFLARQVPVRTGSC
jgi:hypothetical protein